MTLNDENTLKNIKKTGGHFNGLLFVKSCETGVASNSKPYLSVVLQDITGTIDGKKWDVLPGDVEVLVPGRVVEVEGEVFLYRTQMQIKIARVADVDQANISMEDYTASSPIPIEFLKAELEQDLAKIKNADLKKLTETIIKDHYTEFTTYPAAMSFHHAYYSGLLFHSLSICRIAEKVADNYEFLNKDYLIAGSLLHDIGKTIELSGNIATSYTQKGNLIGHINIGANIIAETAAKLGIEGEVPLVLEHMILAHHGVPEFGSAVMPKMAEAYVLHALDDLDSKLNMLETALKGVDGGDFTGKLPGMDGRAFYKIKD